MKPRDPLRARGTELQTLKILTIVAAVALATPVLAGCLRENDGVAGEFDLVAAGVPAKAEAGKAFTFSVTAAGPEARTSDHLGAHYGSATSNAPSTTVYAKACAHTTGNLPGTWQVTCTIAEPGTVYLRGHARTNESGTLKNFWTSEFKVEVEGLASLGELKIGTDAAFPPFEDVDTTTGEFVGFDIDVMNEIGKRAAFTPKFENLGFDPLIPALQNGQIRAAISAMSITPVRSEKVDFSIPYYEANQSASVRDDDAGKYASLASMKDKGLKFGAQRGTVGADKITEEFGEAALTTYDTYPLAIEALKRGDVDAVIMDAPAQKEAAKGDSGIVVAFEFSVGDVYGIPVKKGDTVLLARINTALASMFADGTMQTLRAKWGI